MRLQTYYNYAYIHEIVACKNALRHTYFVAKILIKTKNGKLTQKGFYLLLFQSQVLE